MVLAVYGAGGLGRETLELAKIINKKSKQWSKFIFIDDGDTPGIVSGCEVYKYDDAKKLFEGQLQIVMGIGEPSVREMLFVKIVKDNIDTPSLIHPDIYIPESTRVGKGVIIQSGCSISVGVTIEDYVLLQSMCAIGHDCIIGEGSIISTMDCIAGAVHIGRYAYLGMHTSIKELVSIGSYTIIGMGSIVFKDIPEEMIAMGNPARPMKKNEDKKVFHH